MVFFQADGDRTLWRRVTVPVGLACHFARAGDFDGDDLDDLVVADRGTAVWVRSRGDRTFDPPVPIEQSEGAHWITVGDWNGDGHLDLAASSLLGTNTMTTFVGDGTGAFTLTGGFWAVTQSLEIFSDDFEGGDTSAWSTTVGGA